MEDVELLDLGILSLEIEASQESSIGLYKITQNSYWLMMDGTRIGLVFGNPEDGYRLFTGDYDPTYETLYPVKPPTNTQPLEVIKQRIETWLASVLVVKLSNGSQKVVRGLPKFDSDTYWETEDHEAEDIRSWKRIQPEIQSIT